MDLINYHIDDLSLFYEHFQNVQEQIDYSDNWYEIDPYGDPYIPSWTMNGLYSLDNLYESELVYNGTSLATLKARKGLGYPHADLAIRASVWLSGNSVFEIRGRRKDENNYVSLTVDFLDQTLSLNEVVSGIRTELQSCDYAISDNVDFNIFTLGMCDNNLFVMINDHEVLSVVCNNFIDEYGFSIAVLHADHDAVTQVYFISASEVRVHPAPQLEDSSDLYVLFRKDIKQQIENPSTRNYGTYMNAKILYERYKDLGYSDAQWELLGYPIKAPVTEEFLVT